MENCDYWDYLYRFHYFFFSALSFSVLFRGRGKIAKVLSSMMVGGGEEEGKGSEVVARGSNGKPVAKTTGNVQPNQWIGTGSIPVFIYDLGR